LISVILRGNKLTERSISRQDKLDANGLVANTEPRFLVIGQVTKPHGVQGEVRVMVLTDVPARFQWLEKVYIGRSDSTVEPEQVNVESVRFHKDMALLKLAEYPTREDVEKLRQMMVYVPASEAIPLDEGEYFLYELEGLTVKTDEGENLGSLVEVVETKANNVFVVRGTKGEILLPDIPDVILDIDFEVGEMVVKLMEGMV
jgi:16S rRNA processing protein RimM